MTTKIKKTIYISIGVVALGLGTIGVFLPILPTVPFFLLAAWCFAKSSQRLDCWFRGTSLYKKHIEGLKRGEGMTMKAKIKVVLTVTLLMGLGIFFMKDVPVGQIILALVWVAHVIGFFFVIKTKKEV